MHAPAWSIHTIGGHALGGESDAEWAARLVDDLPLKWAGHLMRRWRAEPVRQRRNLGLLTGCTSLRSASLAGIAPDAKDSTIRQEAEESARDMTRRLGWVHRTAVAKLADRDAEQRERLDLLGQCIEAQHWLDGRGLLDHWPAGKAITVRGALKRVQDAAWWRRVLRRVHAVAIEGTARAIGLVHKRAGCYASDDACERRRGQVARNQASLESVAAVNERGQQYTLAELAAKGPANREIRRHELMTRIAGFELIARECSHLAVFATVTCPSRMHAMRARADGRGVEENPRHDGTKPDEAQRYMARQWGRLRAAADRRGLDLYGFRIAEPNHDGTPHWHAILFHPATMSRGRWAGVGAAAELARLMRLYFLDNDSPGERGAAQHRVTLKPIDWQRGSAAGYVAKYIAKNIDGAHVERDLYGNEAIASSMRVEAWATTWRIRQFQQIGGAPVTIWRELRRLHTEQAAAAPAIALMLEAVNTSSTEQVQQHHHELMQRHTAAHGWASYLGLQGGHRVRRKDLRVRLLKEAATGELGKYGEPLAEKTIGVRTLDARAEWVDMPQHPRGGFRRTFSVEVEVESERSAWIVVPKAFAAAAIERLQGASEASRSGAAVAPWSPVNNCTQPAPAPAAFEGARLFGPSVERHRKLGRWNDWSEKHHEHDEREPEREPGRGQGG